MANSKPWATVSDIPGSKPSWIQWFIHLTLSSHITYTWKVLSGYVPVCLASSKHVYSYKLSIVLFENYPFYFVWLIMIFCSISQCSICFPHRYKLLRYSRERQYIDGLNNLLYTPTILIGKLYKNVTVNLVPELAPVQDYWWNCRINGWIYTF